MLFACKALVLTALIVVKQVKCCGALFCMVLITGVGSLFTASVGHDVGMFCQMQTYWL